ncbi:serine protease HTRA2, mitochondrial [Neocloeon triangulifer]|uniref:serine protease HTRA2, mitochondrial n=1 Tax=Neocloeon triangulifer TaxID=2078957 RepID=UPI00286F0D65|nr:serine protease HTRA2, mitochondrial [Neocloeon triangulifer]
MLLSKPVQYLGPRCIRLLRPTLASASTLRAQPLHSQGGEQQISSSWSLRLATAGGLFAAGVGLGMAWADYYGDTGILPRVEAAQPSAGTEGGSRRKSNNFIADVVKTCSPGVVYIEILDGRFNRMMSNGSGFIVSDDGLIMTNAHVVSSRTRNTVVVKLHDGRSFVGKIEDLDMSADLALIRIPAKNLSPMKLGISNDLESGEWVVAIGSPLSLSNTVTAGVVSTVGRKSKELGLHGKGMEYIQTDASITFGNSGGPLVNLDEEVIGINAMKITAGISFAIPIDYAKDFLLKYLAKAKDKGFTSEVKSRRYMGITMVTITPELRFEMTQRNMISLPEDVSGVFIVKIVVGSPAHKGGLRPGDVITHINGEHVKSVQDIFKSLESSQSLEVAVRRGAETLDFVVVPED